MCTVACFWKVFIQRHVEHDLHYLSVCAIQVRHSCLLFNGCFGIQNYTVKCKETRQGTDATVQSVFLKIIGA